MDYKEPLTAHQRAALQSEIDVLATLSLKFSLSQSWLSVNLLNYQKYPAPLEVQFRVKPAYKKRLPLTSQFPADSDSQLMFYLLVIQLNKAVQLQYRTLYASPQKPTNTQLVMQKKHKYVFVFLCPVRFTQLH